MNNKNKNNFYCDRNGIETNCQPMYSQPHSKSQNLNKCCDHNKESFLVDNKWISRKNEISVEIHNIIEKISESLHNINEDEEFFIQLIRELFIFLKNNTELLNHLNADQYREIPIIIYNIAKTISSIQKFVWREEEFLYKISNLYGFIYLNTNIKNGKVYVGKCELSKTIENRWAEHKNEGRKLKEWQVSEERRRGDAKPSSVKDTFFNRAIAKYGPNVWTLNLIDIAYSKPELIDEEICWIKKKDSMNPNKGYNMQKGGLGGKHNPETIEKLKKISEKRWQDSDFQKKMSEAHKYVWQRPEYKKKMSEIRKNTGKNPEFQKRHSEILKEVWQRSGYHEKMSKVRKDVWQRPGYQEKMSEIHKNTGQNPKFKEKMSIVHKDVWQRPGFQEKISKTQKEVWLRLGYKEKMSKIRKEGGSRKKKILNKREFLTDIKNSRKAKELYKKYDMTATILNVRIKEILGSLGITHYSNAKAFLQDKNIDKILGNLGF